MINPVPGVAFHHVCDYFAVLLKQMTGEAPFVNLPSYMAERTGMTVSCAYCIGSVLLVKGYASWIALRSLTVKGYLFALELERQRGQDD